EGEPLRLPSHVTPFPDSRCSHRSISPPARASHNAAFDGQPGGAGSGYADPSRWNPTASIIDGSVPLAESTEGQIVGVTVVVPRLSVGCRTRATYSNPSLKIGRIIR